MIKKDVIDLILERVFQGFVVKNNYNGKNSDDNYVVSAVMSGQSNEKYALTVKVGDHYDGENNKWKNEKEFGSYLYWDRDGSGDVSVEEGADPVVMATLERKNDEIYLVKKRKAEDEDYKNTETTVEYGSILVSEEKLFDTSDIKSMSFGTTSGWKGEAYQERLPGKKAENERKKDIWIIVLHRSDGAVTICRSLNDLPF